MSNRILNLAKNVDAELKETQEFLELQEAYRAVKEDEATISQFNKLRDIQLQIQEMQLSGQTVNGDLIVEVQQLAMISQQNPLIMELMKKEQALVMIIQEVAKQLVASVQSLYEDNGNN
ncbi:hypothetical protein HCJ39_11475 [Listeria rocourtiae]|uniref:YlbF family regulator n=1 Tax=Listeria rocourtiae TaxID=647910 RepID=UPI0016249B99|nr:YlbF family regulator [Listeria rocourtiae]MBC1605337.1 hypothetical protein [Listeria rocourtiae]